MNKTFLLVVYSLLASTCFANQCCRCTTTAPLRKVGDYYYCNKHYCPKHKLTNHEGKCPRCDLESLLKRGKGACMCCQSTANLTIAKRYTDRWGFFCPNHYCAVHNQTPFSIRSGAWTCPVCENEANKRKREQEKEARIKAQEEYEKNQAERNKMHAENAEKIKQQREQELKDLHTLKAEPLNSLFGVNLGAPPEDIKSLSGTGDIRVFAPEKLFRKFSRYYVDIKLGKVVSIYTTQEFSDWDDAVFEVNSIVELLDKKYDARRRGEVCEDRREMYVRYYFGCNPDTGTNPKQYIYVFARKSRRQIGNYLVTIGAVDAVVSNILKTKEDSANIDAL